MCTTFLRCNKHIFGDCFFSLRVRHPHLQIEKRYNKQIFGDCFKIFKSKASPFTHREECITKRHLIIILITNAHFFFFGIGLNVRPSHNMTQQLILFLFVVQCCCEKGYFANCMVSELRQIYFDCVVG